MVKKFLMAMILLSVGFDNNAMSGKVMGMMSSVGSTAQDSPIMTALIGIEATIIAAMIYNRKTHTQADVNNAYTAGQAVTIDKNPEGVINAYLESDNSSIKASRDESYQKSFARGFAEAYDLGKTAIEGINTSLNADANISRETSIDIGKAALKAFVKQAPTE